MSKRIIPTILLALVILASCGKQENTATSETATSGSFQLVADEVLKPAIDSLVTGFLIENPGATVTVKYTSATEAVRVMRVHGAEAGSVITKAVERARGPEKSQEPGARIAGSPAHFLIPRSRGRFARRARPGL